MKHIVRICTLLLAVTMVLSVGINAYAAGSVTYDGNADEFIFAPGTEESPTSLFENFQNVMPGDTLTEQILIKNDAAQNVKVRVYIRSLGAQEDTEDFLSQLNLTVKQNGDSILFEAPADETAQLTQWTYLGTVYSGGEIVLDVTLEVPITMGNEYQNDIGYIDWQFKIEEFPVGPPDIPQTGDTSNIMLNAGLMVFSFIGLVIVLIIIKKKKEET